MFTGSIYSSQGPATFLTHGSCREVVLVDVYNGEMKADGNSLACVEKGELDWYVILWFL